MNYVAFCCSLAMANVAVRFVAMNSVSNSMDCRRDGYLTATHLPIYFSQLREINNLFTNEKLIFL